MTLGCVRVDLLSDAHPKAQHIIQPILAKIHIPHTTDKMSITYSSLQNNKQSHSFIHKIMLSNLMFKVITKTHIISSYFFKHCKHNCIHTHLTTLLIYTFTKQTNKHTYIHPYPPTYIHTHTSTLHTVDNIKSKHSKPHSTSTLVVTSCKSKAFSMSASFVFS